MKINPTFLGFLAILLWSTSIGLMRTITESLGASAGAALIYSLSGIMIFIFKGIPNVRRFSKIYLYACGLIFVTYEILLSQSIALAQDRAQTMEITLLNYLWPCLTVVFAILFKIQKSRGLIWVGIVFAFLGIVFSLTEGDLGLFISIGERVTHNPISYIFAFTAAVLWALFCCITKKYGKGEDGTSLFLLIVGIVLWIKYLCFDNYPLQFQNNVIIEVICMSLATALGYSFWNHGIQKGNMVLLSIFSYFTPILSIFWASIWLNLSLSLSFWFGVMMVTFGSLICYFGSRNK